METSLTHPPFSAIWSIAIIAQKMVTRELPFPDCINKEFFTLRNPRTKHAKLKNIREGTNNNIVERLNGTKRERLKVMRGLDRDESAQKFVEADMLYYNFIRPHMALNGKTPAEMGGINLKLGQNRWESLIRRSARNKNGK